MKAGIIGVGATGSFSAMLLARKGIGLVIADRDRVEKSNLGRQILYEPSDIGKPKSEAARKALSRIHAGIAAVYEDINPSTIGKYFTGVDILLDGTDNMYSRFLINDFALKMRIPWVYSGVIKDTGSVFRVDGSPCFSCVFKDTVGLDTCDVSGVDNTVVAMTAAAQVRLAMGAMDKSLYRIDGLGLKDYKVKPRNCPACRGEYIYLEGKSRPKIISHNCSGLFEFFLDIDAIRKRLKARGQVIVYRNLTIFRSGKVLVKAENLKEAKSAVSKYLGI